MNIAVVGGGTRCRLLLEMLQNHTFEELQARVVAVADEREEASGAVMARENGIFVTKDYNDLFDREDIDLIIELYGSHEVFYDILAKKKRNVRAFDHRTAQLFWEVSRISNIQEKTEQELEKTKVIVVTALSDQDRRRRMLEAGADAYVNKPIDVVDLKRQVKNLIEIS